MNGIEQWSHYLAEGDLMKATLRATRLYAAAPSIVEPGEPFALQVAALGADGYPDVTYRDAVRIACDAEVEGLPECIEFGSEHQGVMRLEGLSARAEGTLAITLECERTRVAGACNPIWVRRDPEYRIWWGDLHCHSILGKCGEQSAKSPDFGYWFARAVMALDYAGMADHARSLDDDAWQEVIAAARRHHAPERFVTFLGFEGDYDGPDGGHFNFHYPGDHGDYRNFKLERGGTLEAVFAFARERGAIAISHHNGRAIRGRDYSLSRFGGVEVEPLVEVYSKWGSSEVWHSHRPISRGGYPAHTNYVRYALSRGYRFGMIGGSDDHNTCPGSYMDMWYPRDGGRRGFYRSSGLGAIIAPQLTRRALWEAMLDRRCYATAGERFLVDFRIDGQIMGREVVSARPHLQAAVVATSRLREVVVVKDGQEWHRPPTRGPAVCFEAEDPELEGEACYYLRAIDSIGDAAWSSPIWVRRP